MAVVKLIILTFALLLIAVLALSVRLLFVKKGEFHGGSCSSHSGKLKEQGIGCGCGGGSCETN